MDGSYIHCDRRGFSLIELLVTISIISLLVGILLPTLSKTKLKASFVNELNTGRQLMIAYKIYASDNNGQVLPGYRYDFPAKDRTGRSLQHPINARYPWRIAPYLGMNFEILYVNKNRKLLHSFGKDNEVNYAYGASLFPSLAVNSVFVGGDDQVLSPNKKAIKTFGNFAVIHESQATRASKLITFISARSIFQEKIVNGFYRTDPPYLNKRMWSASWNHEEEPSLFGFVHPRYNKKTVAAMFDGHAQSLSLDQTQDMRYWANNADRADWVLEKK